MNGGDKPKGRTTVSLNREQIQKQIQALNDIQEIKQQLEAVNEKVENQIQVMDYFLKIIQDSPEN